MPTPKKNESQSDYVSRCVPQVVGEGRTQDQAVGKCYGMYKSKKKKKKAFNLSLLKVAQQNDVEPLEWDENQASWLGNHMYRIDERMNHETNEPYWMIYSYNFPGYLKDKNTDYKTYFKFKSKEDAVNFTNRLHFGLEKL